MEEKQNTVYKDKSYGQYRELFYSYDESGKYAKTVSKQGETGQAIMQQAWDVFSERIEEAKKKVLAGKASPVVYYMEKTLLDPLNLSMMAGISIWRVKWHFRPAVFRRLSDKTLQKYATAFNITIDQLKKIEG